MKGKTNLEESGKQDYLRDMDQQKQNILMQSLMSLPSAALATSRAVFKFETTSLQMSSRLARTLKNVLIDRPELKLGYIEKLS